MLITAIIIFLLLFSLIVSEKKNYTGLKSFDKITTLPLRGLLALLIISHHLGQNTTIYPLSNFTADIGLQIVAIFFFISGYGLCVSYLEKKERYLDGFLSKRVGKLAPKFILLTVGMVVIFHLLNIYDGEQQLYKVTQGWLPLPFSWFILAILYVYVSFYLCALMVKTPEKLGVLFTIFIVFYFLVMSMLLHFPSWWYQTIISVNAGYFVAYYEDRITSILTKYKAASYLILTVLLLVSFYAVAEIRISHASILFLDSWLIMQIISLYAIIRTLGFFQWNWLCNIGVISLEIYLIHGIPLTIGQHYGLGDRQLWLFTYAVTIPFALFLNWAYGRVVQWCDALKVRAQCE